jgi:hypothetical protein
LYSKARFKNRSVFTKLQNCNWIRNIREINTSMLMEEYVTLFMMLSTVTLHSGHDEIVWRWTANGKYSVKSARAEPKCNFFTWLALHNKTLAADNMEKKNWPCNLTCPLCYCQPEMADHLLMECNYTEALWHIIANRFDLPTYSMLMSKGRLLEWVSHFTSEGQGKQRERRWVLCSPFGGTFGRKGMVGFLRIRSFLFLSLQPCYRRRLSSSLELILFDDQCKF